MDLLKAIRKNDVNKVEKILKKGYYVKINDAIQDTQEQIPIKTIPLCLATARGQLTIVKLLLHYGADVRLWNLDWAPPIHLATYRGYLDIIRYFLSETSERATIINGVDQLGDTPLHIAARYSKTEIVNLLLEHNCELSISNQSNKTALDTAREVYGEESDLICAAIVKKMRELAAGKALPKQNPDAPGASGEYVYPQTAPEPVNKPRPSISMGMPPQRPPATDLDRDDYTKKLTEELKAKEAKIINLEDDITTGEAEKNKIKLDIAKLTEKMNQQCLLISKKEAEKTALEKEVVLINKRLRPQSRMTPNPSVEEKSYECPVCLEIPLPPKHVYQCTNGHIYCGDCKDMPTMHICPQCRVPLDKQNPIRNIAFTEIIGNLFPNNSGS